MCFVSVLCVCELYALLLMGLDRHGFKREEGGEGLICEKHIDDKLFSFFIELVDPKFFGPFSLIGK